jgi:predicted nucleic acid-binding protein
VNYVVDASALVHVVLGTETGVALGPRLTDARIAAPDIVDAEVASALRRHHRRGDLSDRKLSAALDLLLDWPADRIPSRLLVRGTRRWWPNVTAYDALYLAVAVGVSASLLTCDGPLARAPAVGVPVENVRVTGAAPP